MIRYGVYFEVYPYYTMLLGSINSSSDVQMDLSKYFGLNTPRKQVRPSSSTRPPAASRWRHVPPTQEPYDVPADERVPCPTRRAGSVATARIIYLIYLSIYLSIFEPYRWALSLLSRL